MDLLRAAVKAIYNDYPIENAYPMIVGCDSKGGFLEFFNTMVGNYVEGFSPRAIDAYKASLVSDLRGQGFRKENDIQLFAGLSDIHSHFGGAIDSFEFNWISLMNDVGELYDKFKSMSMRYSLNTVTAFNKEYSFKNLANWCRVAAAIRLCLYKVLMKGQTYGKETLLADLLTVGTGDRHLSQA